MIDARPEFSSLSSEIRDLLVRRSDRIRRPALEADGEDDAPWFAVFALGGEEYAIALPILRAAIPLRTVTPVPRSSPVVIGVLQFQGEVIAALSTAALLGSGWDVPPTILLVVDAGGGRTVGLDCAQVPVAAALAVPRQRARDQAAGVLSCVAVPGRGAVNVIDLPRLLDRQNWMDGEDA
ncbi:MAG: chemotaxis protein CheW [Polyangiaceae bacterium]|jgi:purine-binding chemotaxis protein CheW